MKENGDVYMRNGCFCCVCVWQIGCVVVSGLFFYSDLVNSLLISLKITRFRLKPSQDAHLLPKEAKKEGGYRPVTSTKTTSTDSVLWNYITEEEWEHQKRKSTETHALTEKSSVLEETSIPEDNGEDLSEDIPGETAILTARKTREMRRHIRVMQEDEFLAFDDRNETTSRHVREEDELEELDEGNVSLINAIIDP